MVCYEIKSEIYLDKFTECYKKIITINRCPNDVSLNKIIRRVKKNKLSIFDYDCCSEQPHCYNAFVHPETRQLLTIDDVDVLFSYVSSVGYTVDYNLTKIIMKNKKKDSDFLFFITK